MNSLTLRRREVDDPRAGELQEVRLFIDGADLADLVAELERPYAEAEGHPDLAGQYSGPDPADVFLPKSHLLGDPAPGSDWEEDGSIAILRCGCGEWGCWPLLAFVEIGDDVVVWRDFRNPHRPRWSWEALGPFTFDRDQYEAALRST